MKTQKVSGTNKGKIMVYTLSTCVWCKKLKQLLNSLNVAYEYIDVDLLERKEQEQIRKEQEKWNPQCSYPTLVFNDSRCIVGFKEEEIREALQ